MHEQTITVLDTETTGWSPDNGDRIIEVAAARFDPQTGTLGETFHHYLNPGFPVPPQSTAIHGITNEMLEDKPSFIDIANDLERFVNGTRLVIHNASFDVRFLTAEFKAATGGKFASMVAETICTRQMARRSLPPQQGCKLDDLCDLFGIDRSIRTVHGALVDCALLAQVYPHLVKKRDERNEVLASLLPFAPGSDLPMDKDQLGKAYTMINQLVTQLQNEQERIREAISPLLNGQNYEHRDFTVTFGVESTTTDWKKVVEAHLKNVDLSPFQKKSGKPKMTIKAA